MGDTPHTPRTHQAHLSLAVYTHCLMAAEESNGPGDSARGGVGGIGGNNELNYASPSPR